MKLLSLILISLFTLLSCNTKSPDVKAEKESYEKAKESLEEKEKKNPVAFLSVTSRDRHNIIGQMVIKGEVTNHAKVCVYKDIQLELSFYSKTGTLLEKDNETVYETIPPGQSEKFKTKYFAPKGTDSVAIRVTGAKVNG